MLSNDTITDVVFYDIGGHLQSQIFSWYAYAIQKCAVTLDVPGRFVSNRTTSLAVELFLLSLVGNCSFSRSAVVLVSQRSAIVVNLIGIDVII